MMPRHFILATAGHVDHGKSTLIKRLTGIDPDRLPEEKARGMTIDLGFASFAPSPSLSVGIVDVPGHEDFVKNMVSGVGAIDAVLFVVAADDGWMPQSEEHLQILEYLGVHHGVVALTKTDRVSAAEISRSQHSIRQRIAGTFLADAAIIPMSPDSPDSVQNLSTAITSMFDRMPSPPDIGRPRLHIDRSFQLRGVGRIVAGTLGGGTLTCGQSVAVSPTGTITKIRAIQSHGQDRKTASPGTRVALNLLNLPADVEWRGQTVTLPDLTATHDVLDVIVHQSDRATRPRQFRRGVRVHVHHGTRSVPARLFPYSNELENVAQLRLDEPLAAFIGDRVVLRDAAQLHTLAGAIVLDPDAKRGGMNDVKRREFLAEIARHLENPLAIVSAIVRYRRIVGSETLLRRSHFNDEEIRIAIDAAASQGVLFQRGSFLIEAGAWNGTLDTLATRILDHHHSHPEHSGLPITAVSQAIAAALDASLLEPALDDLRGRGFSRLQTIIRHCDHQPMLPLRLRPAGDRIRAVLAAHPLDPPTRSELAPDGQSQQALAFLKLNGEVVELSPQISISAAAFSRAEQIVRQRLAAQAQATATELKAAMATSRRVAIPMLEKLDQLGVTRRDGDLRRLRT